MPKQKRNEPTKSNLYETTLYRITIPAIILLLAGVEIVALYQGVDGNCLFIALTSISVLIGYYLRKVVEPMNNPNGIDRRITRFGGRRKSDIDIESGAKKAGMSWPWQLVFQAVLYFLSNLFNKLPKNDGPKE